MKLLLSNDEIKHHTNLLSQELQEKFNEEIIMVCIMKGGCSFFHLLLSMIDEVIDIDYLTISSYKGTQKGYLNLISDIGIDVRGSIVVLVDDILDTGDTMRFAVQHLLSKGAKKVVPVVLINKKPLPLGFENVFSLIKLEEKDNKFYYGFGMDDSQGKNRGLDSIFYEDII